MVLVSWNTRYSKYIHLPLTIVVLSQSFFDVYIKLSNSKYASRSGPCLGTALGHEGGVHIFGQFAHSSSHFWV